MPNIKDKNYFSDKKVAIIIANFYQDIGASLLSGALETLEKYGINENNIDIFYAPGAFEVPLMAKKLADNAQYNGLITLGAVIRGETPHFDFVAGECISGLMDIGLNYDLSIGFGILTTDNMAQTLDRAGGTKGNKGIEASVAMLEMMAFLDDNLTTAP